MPTFSAFDPSNELWSDYNQRFQTFIKAHSVPENKIAKLFLTNQSVTTYKLLQNLSSQQQPPVDINEAEMDMLRYFMAEQCDPKLFVIWERYKFWSNLKRKPGKSIAELAARIRQDALTCEFSDSNPQDHAMCTPFICSMQNETFLKAIQILVEFEEASKVAKETVNPTMKMFSVRVKPTKLLGRTITNQPVNKHNLTVSPCARCGKMGNTSKMCRCKLFVL